MLCTSLAIMKTCAAPLKEVRFRLDWSTFGEVPFSVFSLGFDLLAIDEGCRYTFTDKDNQYSRLHFPPKPIFRLLTISILVDFLIPDSSVSVTKFLWLLASSSRSAFRHGKMCLDNPPVWYDRSASRFGSLGVADFANELES